MTPRTTPAPPRNALARRLCGDEGAALIVVLAMTGILAVLVGVSFTVAQRGLRVAAAEEDVHGSLAAAEAGLDDYLFRLNTVDAYWQFSDAVPAPDGNAAFSRSTCPAVPTDCNFVPIPGGEGEGEFAYVVDASQLPTTGTIVLTSVGCSPAPCDGAPGLRDRVRAVEAQVRQRSFLEYLYFTDYETLAPIVYGTPTAVSNAERDCARRRWQQERPSSCLEIVWGENDRLNGPFHTNDRFRLGGNARWTDEASNSDPRTPSYDANGHTATFDRGLVYQEPLELPPSNGELFADADYRINAQGCLFTGPTEITLGSRPGHIMVRSPHTRRSGPGCGTWTNGTDPAQEIAIPANGVVYVQGVPSTPGDDNHQASRRGSGGNGLGYPWGSDNTSYNWRAGDAFIEGTLSGRLTVAAANNIVITWHVEYANPATDMLGLIANDLIAIYHPRGERVGCANQRCYYANGNAGPRHPEAPFEDAEISAAMLSLGNSILVQNWDVGYEVRNNRLYCDPLGDLYVNGAIAQTFRGPVGTTGDEGACTGYDKDYNYDTRLAFTSPPRFINPVEAQWVISRFAEQFPELTPVVPPLVAGLRPRDRSDRPAACR